MTFMFVGGKHCVMKRGTKSPRPGRCHDTRAEAIKQQRALYAAEADQQSQSAQEVTGMSTDMTVTFTDGIGSGDQVRASHRRRRLAGRHDELGGRAGDHRVRHQRQAHPDPRRNRKP